MLIDGTRTRDLQQWLLINGVSIPGNIRLEYANAITPDGQTIVGVAVDGVTNQRMSFIATIPTPGAAASIGLGMLMLASRRRQ
jgi:hypothetical protein